jgi:hypothetical protein
MIGAYQDRTGGCGKSMLAMIGNAQHLGLGGISSMGAATATSAMSS